MAGYYSTTGVPFEAMNLADIRDPIITGPGHSALDAAVVSYRRLAEALQTAGADVRGALAASAAAHEGAAADASRAHLSTLATPAEAGSAQARLAAMAIENQATYHVRARNDVQALADATLFESALGVLSPANGRRREAIDAANLYQGNSNHNLGSGFQAFEPPEGGSVGLAPATASPGGGGGGGFGGAGTPSMTGPAGTAPALAGPGASPSAAFSHPPGAQPGGVGSGPPGSGPVPAGAPGSVGPRPSTGAGRLGGLPPRPGATDQGGSVLPPATGAPRPGFGSAPGLRPGAVDAFTPRTSQAVDPVIRGGARSAWGSGGGGAGSSGSGGGTSHGGAGRADSAGPGSNSGGRPSTTGTASAASGAGGSGAGSRGGMAGMPMMGGGGAGGQDSGHRRPSWLVEDDPQAFWFRGIPHHVDPVIEGGPES